MLDKVIIDFTVILSLPLGHILLHMRGNDSEVAVFDSCEYFLCYNFFQSQGLPRL